MSDVKNDKPFITYVHPSEIGSKKESKPTAATESSPALPTPTAPAPVTISLDDKFEPSVTTLALGEETGGFGGGTV
ncbi:MAG: hypothetical protein ACT4TC_24815, partial [Myxococcaceae bacterium]